MFGFHPGEVGAGAIIAVSDCFPTGGAKYKGYTWRGDMLEPNGMEPRTSGYFLSSAIQQVKLFFLLGGEERKEERPTALRHLRKFHEGNPELSTPPFLVESWNRLWFEYSEAVRDGILFLNAHSTGRGE